MAGRLKKVTCPWICSECKKEFAPNELWYTVRVKGKLKWLCRKCVNDDTSRK